MNHFVIMALVCLATLAPAAADDHKLWISSWSSPIPIPASKAKLVHDGITLRKLVEACGPGWCTPSESAGVLRWIFEDGRRLSVWPAAYSDAEVITFRGSGGRPRMWWSDSEVTTVHPP